MLFPKEKYLFVPLYSANIYHDFSSASSSFGNLKRIRTQMKLNDPVHGANALSSDEGEPVLVGVQF
jgi:hypothetical protein